MKALRLVMLWALTIFSSQLWGYPSTTELKGFIMTNGPCMPMTKGSLKAGDEIASSTVIGVAAAEGENIPYDKPYCVFVEV